MERFVFTSTLVALLAGEVDTSVGGVSSLVSVVVNDHSAGAMAFPDGSCTPVSVMVCSALVSSAPSGTRVNVVPSGWIVKATGPPGDVHAAPQIGRASRRERLWGP